MQRREFLRIGVTGAAAGICTAGWPWRADAGVLPLHDAIDMFARARRESGLAVPRIHTALAESALQQAMHMARIGAAFHAGPDGANPAARARQAGFEGQLMGEALAETYESPADTMAFWLSHAPTRDILMDRAVHVFGFGAVIGQDGRLWFDLAAGAARTP